MSSSIPRFTLEEMPVELAAMLRPRVERLGYLGEFFQCAANQPRALMLFQDFTEALKKALPEKITELVALSVAQLMDNPYERIQHERLSVKLGFGERWIKDVLSFSLNGNDPVAEQEISVQQLVKAVIERRGHDVGGELDCAIRHVGPKCAVAILMLIGRFVTHAYFVNSLALEPPVPSILSSQNTEE